MGRRSACPTKKLLLLLLLLLLADADLKAGGFGVHEGFVVVSRHGISEVRILIGFLRKHGHQGEAFVAGRAEGPEPLYIRNCHNSIYSSITSAARFGS